VTFQHGFILASSRSSLVADELIDSKYDLALFAGSWDDRCLAIIAVPRFTARGAILISFAANDPAGKERQNANEAQLVRFFEGRGVEVHRVRGVSENVEAEFPRLWELVRTLVGPRPAAKCFVDLSACPRYYSLGAIAGLVSTGLTAQIDVLYAEGEYTPVSQSPYPADVPFSLGRWNCVPIPFLRGPFEPSLPRFHLVSAGFEGGKTLRLLEREEATHVTLMYPIPGVTAEYDREVRERNGPVVNRFGVPADRIVAAPAGNAIAAWRVAASYRGKIRRGDVRYLCCGTKAQSLGLALSAVSTRDSSVMYNVPERHRYVDVRPNGRLWLYRIRDLSALCEADR
jgi:hypothetical protein